MSRKTRKLIWSAPLVAVLAVAVALAIFMAQIPGAALASHDPPGVVANLTGAADGTTQIDLSWDAPATGGTLASYRIDRSTDGNAWKSLKTGHTIRTYSDTGLDPDTSYYYRVFAVNSSGTGPVSQDYEVQTDAVEMPDQVIGLRATAVGQNQVNLNWTAPSDDGGAPITKYSIHFASGTTAIPVQGQTPSDGDVIEVDAADGTSYQHKMLTANTRYKYIVYAWNMAAGKAEAESDIAAATTAVLEKPGAPSGVKAVQAVDGRTLSLYWFAPSDNGGKAFIDYDVEAQYNGRGAYVDVSAVTIWRAEHRVSSADTTHVVPPNVLPEATPPVAIESVRYRVYAVTRRADTSGTPPVTELKSGASSVSPRVMILDTEDRAEAIPDGPTFLRADAVREPQGNVNLEWTAPSIDATDGDTANNNAPDSIGGYRIDVSDDGLNWSKLTNHTRKTATEYQYVDPANENRYYRIFAWHAQHLGPAQSQSVLSEL